MNGPALSILKKRADFLRTARGKRAHLPGLVLQARERTTEDPATGIRVGFTCSKKVGNAVARNRAKRRLREAARTVLPDHGHAGFDYVLIGRAGLTGSRPWTELLGDLERGLSEIHRK